MAPTLTYYPYFQPSQDVAGVACALFSIGFLVSLYQTIRYKAWIWFFMVLAVGMEAAGYGARIDSAGHPAERTIFIVQFCLVVLAPVFMAGIIYVAFGRIVFHVVPSHARTTRLLWAPPRWIAPIFVGLDILALFTQLIGAVIVAGTQPTDPNAISKLNTGKTVALIGVSMQIGGFGLFSIIAVRFHFTSKRFLSTLGERFHAVPGGKSRVTLEGGGRSFHPNWRRLLFAINASCVMILVRSVYREIDFAGGKGGTLDRHEFYQYVLDAIPIFILVVLYTIVPPGLYVHMGLRQPKDKPSGERSTSSDGEAFAMPSRPGV